MKDFRLRIATPDTLITLIINEVKPLRFDGRVFRIDRQDTRDSALAKITGSLLASHVLNLKGQQAPLSDMEILTLIGRGYTHPDFRTSSGEFVISEPNLEKLITRDSNYELVENEVLRKLLLMYRLTSPSESYARGLDIYASLPHEIPVIQQSLEVLLGAQEIEIANATSDGWNRMYRIKPAMYRQIRNRLQTDQDDSSGSQEEAHISYDFFLCHATEDKVKFSDALAHRLVDEGFKVWYDDFVLKLGDSLRRRIEDGLARSAHGIVVLSEQFFRKEWPQKELDGLFQLESHQKKIIPIWLDLTCDQVRRYSAMLADRKAIAYDSASPLPDFLNRFMQEIRRLQETN